MSNSEWLSQEIVFKNKSQNTFIDSTKTMRIFFPWIINNTAPSISYNLTCNSIINALSPSCVGTTLSLWHRYSVNILLIIKYQFISTWKLLSATMVHWRNNFTGLLKQQSTPLPQFKLQKRETLSQIKMVVYNALCNSTLLCKAGTLGQVNKGLWPMMVWQFVGRQLLGLV